MLPYVIISGVVYSGSILSVFDRRTSVLSWSVLVSFAIALSAFIGFRFEVGKDWIQYNYIFKLITELPFIDAMDLTDAGYSFLNWLSHQLGFGISAVFFFCAVVLVVGLMMFAAMTPYPWLAMAVAMPHIVTIMAMDHIRQTTALGFILIGLAFLKRDRVWVFLGCIVLGALFHRTAIICLIFGLLLVQKNRLLLYPAVLGISALLMEFLLADQIGVYILRYVETSAGSRGALIRLLLNALPAVGFLIYGKYANLPPRIDKVMKAMAWAAVFSLILLPLLPSPVIIDRIGKYFLPVQILFFPLIVSLLRGYAFRFIATSLICAYLFLTQFYWLYTSELADFWVPYKMTQL
ncbi:EpsG family protein [Pseudovibrio ascidiaceicola]|uniref:EpsG family protein n=1 Tax=Pseudovibrio ascidiaceicola TaxID=285279 RepID=UPI000D6898B0|nr:EpsG family protein [Pseudovibrio ascidiaceicola]